MRNYLEYIEDFWSNVIDICEPDIFVHTWRENGITYRTSRFFDKEIPPFESRKIADYALTLPDVTEEDIRDAYRRRFVEAVSWIRSLIWKNKLLSGLKRGKFLIRIYSLILLLVWKNLVDAV